MNQPETDENFRARLLRVVTEQDRHMAMVGITHQLDELGRKYGLFRYGVALKEKAS